MAEVANPHDRFFKAVFSRPEAAEGFSRRFLPERVAGSLLPGTFRLRKDSFVDSQLKESFSDLVYEVDLKEGHKGFVCILFEHKSYPAPDTALQLLRYKTRIWEQASKETGLPLPPVIPMVLYNGRVRWRIPLSLAALYGAPDSLKEGLCDFTYYVCDLSAQEDEGLKLDAMTTVALRLMKNIHSENLADRLRGIFTLFRAMNEQTALEFLETVMRYLSVAAETVTPEDCRKAVEVALPGGGDEYMERFFEEMFADKIALREKQWAARERELAEREAVRERELAEREAVREREFAAREQELAERERVMKKEGAAALATRLLTAKFGKLEADVEDRVRQLCLEDLERLAVDLLGFPDESALIGWLDHIEK